MRMSGRRALRTSVLKAAKDRSPPILSNAAWDTKVREGLEADNRVFRSDDCFVAQGGSAHAGVSSLMSLTFRAFVH